VNKKIWLTARTRVSGRVKKPPVSITALAVLITLLMVPAAPAMARSLAPARTATTTTESLKFVPACINCQQGSFVNMAHNLCLDAVRSGDGSSGDNVQLWNCNGGDNQTWYMYDGGTELINLAHGLCLDAVSSGDGSNGDNVQLWTCRNTSNQHWYLTQDFAWSNGAHGLYLDAVASGDGSSGDNVQLWAYTGASNQKWNAFV